MTEELRAQMEALRELAPRLNKTSDSAASIIKTVEKFLNDLGIGVSGIAPHFDYDHEVTDDGPRHIYSHLAYGRMHGDFSIHVANRTCREEINTYGMTEELFDSEELTAWSSCTRETKLKSFATLPGLLSDILANAKEQAEAADKTAATVREMMETLGSGPVPPAATTPPLAGEVKAKGRANR